MAWDSSRPVQWRRLIREWLIYVGIASAAFIIWFLARGKTLDPVLFVGLLASGPMYLMFSYVLAKLGYQRKTYRDLRAQREVASVSRTSSATASSATGSRTKPPPTKRTSTGPSQHRKSTKPKRR